MDQNFAHEQSFLKLYDELAGAIFRHCYFRVSSKELAEDLTQETFMRVWNYLVKGEKIDNPKAFLYQIASHLVIDYYRKKKEASLDALSDLGYDPVGDDATTILEFAEGKHARILLEKLEPSMRDILIMRYVDGLPIGAIAEKIGESENVVSVRTHRAIQKLKKLFQHGKI